MLILSIRPGETILIGPVRFTLVTLPSTTSATVSFHGPVRTWFRAMELSAQDTVMLGGSDALPVQDNIQSNPFPRITRKVDEVVLVSVEERLFEVTVLEVNDRRSQVKFGFTGPREILVIREALLKPKDGAPG